MQNYNDIIFEIKDYIINNGIKKYLNKWKPPKIPKKFNNEKEFIKFANKYLKSYHSHSLFEKYISLEKLNKDKNKLPEFTYDAKNKIVKIKLNVFWLDDSNYSKKRKRLKIKLIKDYIKNHDVKGIIIDLRQHYGGGYIPDIIGLCNILGNGTVGKWDKYYTNLIDCKLKYNGPYIKPDIPKVPIAIIIGKNTASSGELVAMILSSRKNTKTFGSKSYGKLSANISRPIKKGKYIIHLTVVLPADSNHKVYKNEYITPEVKTNKPIYEAKKWLIKKMS